MSTEDNKQIVRSAFEALMGGDRGPLQTVLAPNAILHQCGFLQPIPAQAILRGDFPGTGRLHEREVRIDRMIGEDDIVALHWRTTGAYVDPDSPERHGTRVDVPSMTFVRLDCGRIAEIWNIRDTSTLQSQLDAVTECDGTSP